MINERSTGRLGFGNRGTKILSRLTYVLYRLSVLTSGYSVSFGTIRGPALLLTALLIPAFKGRRVKPRGHGAELFLRLGTSDVEVFAKVYGAWQYQFDLPDSPELIIDAGAYTGISTSWFASRYPAARVIAVEPVAENYRLLVENTKVFPNVLPTRAALWSKPADLSVVDPGRGKWGFRVEPSRSTSQADSVSAVTVPQLLAQSRCPRVDLLKLDIEGAEVQVLGSSGEWIDDVDAIIAELHDDFQPGCSRAFYQATRDFPCESRSGESIFVSRKSPPSSEDVRASS